MFIGSSNSDTPGPAPTGWVWVQNPGRPREWSLACDTKHVSWAIAAQERTAWYLRNTTPKG